MVDRYAVFKTDFGLFFPCRCTKLAKRKKWQLVQDKQPSFLEAEKLARKLNNKKNVRLYQNIQKIKRALGI